MAVLDIQENKLYSCSKRQWKEMVKSRIKFHNRKLILESIKHLKKVDYFKLKDQEFEIQPYFRTMTLKDSRTMASIKLQTTNTVKTHQMSNKQYSQEMWKCNNCSIIDSVNHIKICEAY